jgi:outer membrane protein assembly factor BamB
VKPGPVPGYVMIADRDNNRVLIVSPSKRVVWRYDGLRGPDDAFFTPGYRSIITNEEFNDTLTEVSLRGRRRIWRYGHDAVAGSGPGYLNTPDDAYLLPNGLRTVADAYNCRVLFIRHRRIVRQIGRTGVCVHDPPRTIESPNGDTPLPNGGVLVSEITGSWIDDFSKTGKLLWSFQAPVSYPSDPQPLSGRRILLADYARPGHVLILTRRGRVLWRYGPTSGWGELDHPSLAIMLPNGNIAVNDDYNDRVVIIDPKKRRIVWQYGHLGHPGKGRNQLNTPDGMDYVPLGVHEKPLWQLVHHP